MQLPEDTKTWSDSDCDSFIELLSILAEEKLDSMSRADLICSIIHGMEGLIDLPVCDLER